MWNLVTTKLKLFNNTEINTKLLRFRINNLQDLKLSQNAKIILESCYVPSIVDNALDVKHNSNIILKFKNVSDSKCYDSGNDNNGSTIIFSHSIQSRPQKIVATVNTTLAGVVLKVRAFSFELKSILTLLPVLVIGLLKVSVC